MPLAVVYSGVRAWPLRRWLVAALVAAAVAFATGIPTDVVSNPLYRRMTPVVWWNYPIWAANALLVGLIAATYVRTAGGLTRRAHGVTFAGGLLSFFAVGCPICNKLVVAVLGVSGALAYFGPVQPFLGVAAVALLVATLAVRLRTAVVCPAEPGS
jgi:hypothetical protein